MLKALNTAYVRILKPILFRVSPETAQKMSLFALTILERTLPIPFFYPQKDDQLLSVTRWGIRFSNPIGLVAGVDKNARAGLFWQKFGFGFAELGTITPRHQSGNPKPRIWRLPDQRALVNSLGFPSKGSVRVERRLRFYRHRGIRMKIALNLGPNKDSTSSAQIVRDYANLFARLAPFADFIVINVSSPNTPGLRNWQAPDRMVSIVRELRSTPIVGEKHPPVLVKIGPDLDTGTLREICAAAAAAEPGY